MKSIPSVIITTLLSIALMTPKSTHAANAFGIDVKAGLQSNQHYSLDGCGDCQSVPLDSGMNMGLELSYRVKDLRVGLLADNQGEIFGPNQAYFGASATYLWDHRQLSFGGGLEGGLHYIEEYGKLFGPYSINDTDWALLPYLGLRANADWTVWPAAGLHIGLWTALRADLSTLDQKILMEEGFLSDEQTMETYRAGGLQFSGGVKLGLTL
jgi:hypothetical protein